MKIVKNINVFIEKIKSYFEKKTYQVELYDIYVKFVKYFGIIFLEHKKTDFCSIKTGDLVIIFMVYHIVSPYFIKVLIEFLEVLNAAENPYLENNIISNYKICEDLSLEILDLHNRKFKIIRELKKRHEYDKLLGNFDKLSSFYLNN